MVHRIFGRVGVGVAPPVMSMRTGTAVALGFGLALIVAGAELPTAQNARTVVSIHQDRFLLTVS